MKKSISSAGGRLCSECDLSLECTDERLPKYLLSAPEGGSPVAGFCPRKDGTRSANTSDCSRNVDHSE